MYSPVCQFKLILFLIYFSPLDIFLTPEKNWFRNFGPSSSDKELYSGTIV